MPKNIYTKEDLMWEATRRNEEYKSEYFSLLKKYRNELKDNNYCGRLPYDSTERWDVLLFDETDNRTLFGWQDPSVDIDQILEEIASGASPFAVHPHKHKHVASMTDPYLYYHHMIDPGDPLANFSEHSIRKETYVCIEKEQLGNRFLLVIDPLSEDESIMKVIKQIKKEILGNIKKETDTLKKKGETIFYPRDIVKYIGWLRKYDEIIDHVRNEKGEKYLLISNGVLTISDNVSLKEMVPSDTHADKFEGQWKAYRDAYKGAIQLIRSAPHIVFSPSRT